METRSTGGYLNLCQEDQLDLKTPQRVPQIKM